MCRAAQVRVELIGQQAGPVPRTRKGQENQNLQPYKPKTGASCYNTGAKTPVHNVHQVHSPLGGIHPPSFRIFVFSYFRNKRTPFPYPICVYPCLSVFICVLPSTPPPDLPTPISFRAFVIKEPGFPLSASNPRRQLQPGNNTSFSPTALEMRLNTLTDSGVEGYSRLGRYIRIRGASPL